MSMSSSFLKVSRLARVKKGPIRFFWCFLPIFLSACITESQSSAPADLWEERLNFTGWTDPGEPYPKEGYVYRELWRNGGKDSEHLAFIVWDVNRDDRPDMFDNYNSEGHAMTRVFDFDFDGVQDWSKQLHEKAPGKSKEISVIPVR